MPKRATAAATVAAEEARGGVPAIERLEAMLPALAAELAHLKQTEIALDERAKSLDARAAQLAKKEAELAKRDAALLRRERDGAQRIVAQSPPASSATAAPLPAPTTSVLSPLDIQLLAKATATALSAV